MTVPASTPAQDTPIAGNDNSGETAPVKEAPATASVESTEQKSEGSVAKTEAKETEEQKPVVPEKYDLKLPEESPLDASHVEKIASYAKERGLSNEDAQALLEREHQAVADFAKGQMEVFESRKTEWLESAQTDKEIGGEAFKENAELAKRVIQKFGSEALKNELDKTGLGNHPELVRVFVRIGKQMSNDSLVIPGAQSGGKKSMEDIFYGNNNKEN